MISMRYGTLPVVRETGGLKDSVRPNGVAGATGFTFADINAHDMVWVLNSAVDLYYNNKEAWKSIQHTAMTADFSWNHSAQDYLQVYRWVTNYEESVPFEEPAPAQEIPAAEPVAEPAAGPVTETADAPVEPEAAPVTETADVPAEPEAAPVAEAEPAAKKPAAKRTAKKAPAEKAAAPKRTSKKAPAKKDAAEKKPRAPRKTAAKKKPEAEK